MQAIAPTTLVPSRAAPRFGQRRGAARTRRRQPLRGGGRARRGGLDRGRDRPALGGASFHSLDSGRADGHGHGKLGLSDIAVLYRTDGQAGALGQALTRAGLPCQKRSHDLLARRPAVTDIVREMRLVGGRRGCRSGS